MAQAGTTDTTPGERRPAPPSPESYVDADGAVRSERPPIDRWWAKSKQRAAFLTDRLVKNDKKARSKSEELTGDAKPPLEAGSPVRVIQPSAEWQVKVSPGIVVCRYHDALTHSVVVDVIHATEAKSPPWIGVTSHPNAEEPYVTLSPESSATKAAVADERSPTHLTLAQLTDPGLTALLQSAHSYAQEWPLTLPTLLMSLPAWEAAPLRSDFQWHRRFHWRLTQRLLYLEAGWEDDGADVRIKESVGIIQEAWHDRASLEMSSTSNTRDPFPLLGVANAKSVLYTTLCSTRPRQAHATVSLWALLRLLLFKAWESDRPRSHYVVVDWEDGADFDVFNMEKGESEGNAWTVTYTQRTLGVRRAAVNGRVQSVLTKLYRAIKAGAYKRGIQNNTLRIVAVRTGELRLRAAYVHTQVKSCFGLRPAADKVGQAVGLQDWWLETAMKTDVMCPLCSTTVPAEEGAESCPQCMWWQAGQQFVFPHEGGTWGNPLEDSETFTTPGWLCLQDGVVVPQDAACPSCARTVNQNLPVTMTAQEKQRFKAKWWCTWCYAHNRLVSWPTTTTQCSTCQRTKTVGAP